MNLYKSDYFEEKIFDSDYAAIAAAIRAVYDPEKVIEFGCGPGHLATELAKLGVSVDAIDGFSNPDFSDYSLISFERVDLNDPAAIETYLRGKTYDMAISTEVAEHLLPSSSGHLIKNMTSCAPVVVFSAAVPEQTGQGHINCQTRGFWHDLFTKNNFEVRDELRKRLRTNEQLALWYKLNLLDYVTNASGSADYGMIVRNLVESESYSSSLFYKVGNENIKNKAYLDYAFVKQYFQFRSFLKRLIGK